ncbi:unnamed protein product [Brachionus calyciflorus]|uniref:Uncharacterized protein n=1 Tax=Brachionus calyciflorus TaxID=104777 RepID=A0A814D2C1_9BILA|nr:unnamed protein product [Brachionus calyciflorus]
MKSIKNIIDKRTTASAVNERQSNFDSPKKDPKELSKKIALFNKKFDYENNEYDHESDEVTKDDYDASEEDFQINEMVTDSKNFSKKLSSKYSKKRENSTIKKEILNNQSDTASSCESGFATDDLDSNKNSTENHEINSNENPINDINVVIEKNDKLMLKKGLNQQKSIDSSSSENSNLTPGQISFPILQPPKKLAYELNNSDDIVNILNDNSSMNSSTSSTNSFKKSNWCVRILEKFLKFLCSCFCCYSPSLSSNNHQPPFVCSWLTIFCCCCPLLGGISLIMNHRSKKYKQKQKYELADRYSGYAEKLNIAALILGIIFYAIGFFILTLVLFIYWKANHF